MLKFEQDFINNAYKVACTLYETGIIDIEVWRLIITYLYQTEDYY